MKRTPHSFLPPTLALVGLSACCLLLWNLTSRFLSSVEKIAEDARVSLIDLDGKVVYDTSGQDLPNHSDRAEFEAVKADGRARSVVRESETLHVAMLYHARRVGDFVLRIAVPHQAVTDARAYAAHGLVAAIGIGALVVLAIFFFMRRYERHLADLDAERALQDKLLGEMRKLEEFRRDFISNLTHEIKTPVTGILGAVEILADATATLDETDRRELRNVLKEQAVRLNALVDDILALAHLEKAESDQSAELVPCNVTDIVQTVVNLFQPLARRSNVSLAVGLPSDGQRIAPIIRPCDPRLIESATANLVQNALRHSGSADVTIRVERLTAGKVAICVSDRGIGIPPECQPRLFERFYRIDKNRSRALGGTGLGLAIVKHIAHLHRGEVSVASAPGAGATFRLVF